jgi:hypothetical protein
MIVDSVKGLDKTWSGYMHRVLTMRTVSGLLLVAAIVSTLPIAAAADDEYPTNLELVERAVEAAVDSMEIRPPVGATPDLEIVTSSGGDAAWLLDSVLKGKLLEMGWRVQVGESASNDGSGAEPGFQLTLQIIDLGLKYGRTWRRFLLGTKTVERIARVSIYYELVDNSTDRLVVSSNARSERRDTVPASRLSVLSDSKYTFANPEVEKSQWDRYVEGGLVLAIVGILVYLFYSNKTAS